MADTELAEQYVIDPGARLPYTQDWTPWLAEYTDTIASCEVAVTKGTATIEGKTNDQTSVTYYVKDAVLGSLHVTVTITTTAGLITKKTDVFRVAPQ